MPEYHNTDNLTESPLLDTEDWEIALQPYEANPDAALLLSVNLSMLKLHITEATTISEAMAELDRAIEVLFLHSQFHDVSYLLFRQMAEGKLSFEQQTMLKTLGIKL
jgi:hypothetical protein